MARFLLALLLLLNLVSRVNAQDPADAENHAGHTPVISGGLGYIHIVSGGVTTLEPQINPVLLVPFGPHVLLESRTDFTGFFQRQHATDGPFTGKVFKTVEFAQIDWLLNTHAIVSAGKYLLPFGLYGERLEPIWIKNLQDSPIIASIGTRTSGSGEGLMLRGVLTQQPRYSVQYSSYLSARVGTNQLQAARLAGGDGSIYLTREHLELGASYQRFLQSRHINSEATYLSWQPPKLEGLDLKAEADYSYYGKGYWLEGAYLFQELPIPAIFRRTQLVSRIQQVFPDHGGGNGLPGLNTQRFDAGLNYYLRDDLRFVSSYGRTFSSQADTNVWNVGFTYRFLFPLWPGRSH